MVMAVAATLSIIQSDAWAMDNAQGKQLADQAINGDASSLQQLKLSAADGDAVAENALGRYFGIVQKDYLQAEQWYRKAADQGNAKAQANLGVMYANGQGVRQDYAQAVQWYRKAADQGYAVAQYNLGVMYENGQGAPRDYAQAEQWYRKAAAQGDAVAQFNLGVMYVNGQGVPRDYAQAERWYRKAAEQGNADAQNNLGSMYDNGQGVPQDYAQAAQWYRKAAEQGNANGQNGLGTMYAQGQGVPQDYAQAVQWLRKAADQGNTDAQHNLRSMTANGQGGEQSHAQAEQGGVTTQSRTDSSSGNTQSVEQPKIAIASQGHGLLYVVLTIALTLMGCAVVYLFYKKQQQMNATDKLIQRKLKELAAKGETAVINPLFYARWSKLLLAVGVIIVLPGAAFAFASIEGYKKDFILGVICQILGWIIMAGGGWVIQKGRAAGRLYDLADKYRDALIDKGVRSMTDLSTLTDSSPDEIVDELKELQEVGLFRNFSIDRKNMQLIENAGWGDAGSNKLAQVAFSCSSCGANNSIYTEATASSGVCEYCGSSVAL